MYVQLYNRTQPFVSQTQGATQHVYVYLLSGLGPVKGSRTLIPLEYFRVRTTL